MQPAFAQMVTNSLSFRIQSKHRPDVLSAAETLLAHMRHMAGCADVSLLAQVHDPNSITLLSEWTDAMWAEAFAESREFQHFRVRVLRDEPTMVLEDVRAMVTRLARSR